MSVRWIEITTVISCQNFCSYCPQQMLIGEYARDGKKGDLMSMETFEQCLDKIPKDYEVHFSGYAEPFQNPLCMDMIESTRQSGYTMQLYTTLRFVTVEMMEELKGTRVKKVVVHLPDTDMKFKPKQAFFDVLAMARDGAFNCRRFEFVALIPEVLPEILTVVPKSCIRFATQISRGGNLGEWVKHGGEVECDRSPELKQNVLLPDGRVQVCCSDYGMKYTMGNLKTDELVDMEVDPTPMCLKCEFARQKR